MLQNFDLKKKLKGSSWLRHKAYIVRREEQWNMVPFSDESKFNLFGSDGKRFVRRKMENAYLLNALRKLWNLEEECNDVGMISSLRVGPIVRFYSNINVSVY